MINNEILLVYRHLNATKSKSINDIQIKNHYQPDLYVDIFMNRQEEYVSVYSHDPIANQEITSEQVRIGKIFTLLKQNGRSVNDGHGVLELKIKDILDEVNFYKGEGDPDILSLKNCNHPHYGLMFDRDNSSHIDLIIQSIHDSCSLYFPYKIYKEEKDS